MTSWAAMTFWQAMKALEEGTRVRKTCWNSHEYICIDDKNVIVNQKGEDYITLCYRGKYTWELYQEPKTKKQVWQWRFWSSVSGGWKVHSELSEKGPDAYKIEKHAGPFEVEE